MKHQRLPWKREHQFVEPGITADGMRIYPFDPTFPIDVSFVIASGRHLVRMNRHDFFETIYVYSGSAEIQVQNRHLRMKKGDLVVIGPHIYHHIVTGPRMEVKLVSLNFQPEVIRSVEVEGDDETFLSPFLCQDAQFPHVISGSRAWSREVLQLMLRVHRELPARTPLKRLTVKTTMRMLLLLVLKHFADYLGTREAIARKQRDVQRLRPLFQLLDQTYGQHIEVGDAARACAMSASHFMRFFRLTTGQSFRAYLTSFRIAKAQLMLSTGEAPIAEIGQQVGFCGQSYFGEVFRGLVGMTPRSYRRRFGAKVAAT